MKEKKSGVSLAVLIVTIVTAIILAGVSISTIIDKRYFEETDYASFMSSIESYRDELEDYIGDQEVLNNGRYDRKSLNADKNKLTYKGSEIARKTIKDILPTINDKYIDIIVVEKGNIKYTGNIQKYIEQVNMVTE